MCENLASTSTPGRHHLICQSDQKLLKVSFFFVVENIRKKSNESFFYLQNLTSRCARWVKCGNGCLSVPSPEQRALSVPNRKGGWRNRIGNSACKRRKRGRLVERRDLYLKRQNKSTELDDEKDDDNDADDKSRRDAFAILKNRATSCIWMLATCVIKLL